MCKMNLFIYLFLCVKGVISLSEIVRPMVPNNAFNLVPGWRKAEGKPCCLSCKSKRLEGLLVYTHLLTYVIGIYALLF